MRDVLSKAGRAALRAILPALFVLATGLLAAKDLDGVKAQATVGIIAVAAAAIGALQAFVPFLSFRAYTAETYAKYLDAFTQAFVGTLFSLGLGLLAAPDQGFSRAALTGLLVGALTAAVRAVQALFTPGETPVAGTGITASNV